MKVDTAQLRSLASRDAFLDVVSVKLDRLVYALETQDYPPALRADLVSFVRELGLVARPNMPIALRRTRVDLLQTVSRFFDPARLSENKLAVHEVREGTLVGAWDVELLGTVVAELVSNAIKYRGASPITIDVAVSRGKARIVVGNEANGAVASSRRRRPERFVRGETRRQVRGFGVGLWLVERITKAHGGTSRLTTREGKTSAIVSLPFTRATGAARLSLRLVDT